jgi:hypothetical protein
LKIEKAEGGERGHREAPIFQFSIFNFQFVPGVADSGRRFINRGHRASIATAKLLEMQAEYSAVPWHVRRNRTHRTLQESPP